MPNIFNPDFKDFLKILSKNKVDYILVGGYAVILHGYIRSTGDMDLWVEKNSSNYEKLKLSYHDFGAPIFGEDEFLSETVDVWSIGREPNKIEILTHLTGLEFDNCVENCEFFTEDKLIMPYIFIDDLLINKMATGRYKDLNDVEQLNKKK